MTTIQQADKERKKLNKLISLDNEKKSQKSKILYFLKSKRT